MTTFADQPAGNESISFDRQIRPILQAHCHGCHQPAKASGDYVMTRFDALTRGGESEEPAIVPGDPDGSYLVEQIRAEEGEALMPQEGEPLTSDQFKLIVDWIRQGAQDDTPAQAAAYDMDHPPQYAAPPVVTSLDFSPDGSVLAISGYHEVVIHHADGSGIASRLVGLSDRIESVAFSPEGRRLAVAGGSPCRQGELQIWNWKEKELERSIIIGADTLYGASWSPDGRWISFGCPDHTVRVIEADTGNQILFNGAHEDWVLDTVFSVKADHLVTVSRDMSMKLIHVATERFVDNITSITPGALKGGLNAVDRHPERDEVAAGGADGVARLYRMYREKARKIGDDYNLIRAFPAQPGRIFDLEFSPDGQRLVVGSSLDGRGVVRVYAVEDGKQLLDLPIPDGGVYAVAFHSDGTRIAAGGFDGRVRIAEVSSGKIVHAFFPVPLTENVANRSTAEVDEHDTP